MGETSAAFAEGSQALFWNPAGLARLAPESRTEATLGYSNFLQTTYAGSAGLAKPLGPGVFGASFLYFSQAPQTAYSSIGDADGQFTPYDIAAGLSYAGRIQGVLIGGTAKIIRSELAEVSGTTGAIDFGVQIPHASEARDGAIDVGAAVSNLGPALKLGSVSSPLPFSIRGGFFWHMTPLLGAGADVVLPVDNDPYVCLGGEFSAPFPGGKGAVRLGFNQNETRSINGFAGLTAGGGLQFQSLRVDYAWAPYGDLGMTNRVTLGFYF